MAELLVVYFFVIDVSDFRFAFGRSIFCTVGTGFTTTLSGGLSSLDVLVDILESSLESCPGAHSRRGA